MRIDSSGGFAESNVWEQAGLSHIRRNQGDSPSTAIADIWAPPSPMALPPDLCNGLREFALNHCEPITVVPPAKRGGSRPRVTGYHVGYAGREDRCPAISLRQRAPDAAPPNSVFAELARRLKAANRRWWGLSVDAMTVAVKRYADGGDHPAHTDWQATSDIQGLKVSASIPLNPPEEYEGGELLLRCSHGPAFPALPTPDDQGTFTAFPSWTMHEVTPVTAGERWAAIVQGFGPRLR